MTNEQYLYVSYFAAVGVALGMVVVVTMILRRPHAEALGATTSRLGPMLRRVFPPWLILAVLMGFLSVSYFDCGHGTYESIVENREYLVRKTGEQTSAMARYLAAALTGYGLVMVLALWVRARHGRNKTQDHI